MIYARIVLALSAIMYAGFGTAYLARPKAMAKLTHFELPTPTAVTEIRAFYGGMELGLAALLVVCAIRPAWAGAGLLALALLSGGAAVARLVGFAADGSATPLLWKVLAAEVLVAVLGVVGLVILKRP
jgi:hypothetical protein